MKKIIAAILTMTLLCSLAAAETVYVTISDGNGVLAMANAPVETTDIDADGVLTIHDALTAAHDAAYEGGAAAGYAAADQGYGLSIHKLWGEENGGSYGYYVNNASAYSLVDPVAEGDCVQAYVFTDLEMWSDTFCFFDVSAIETSADFELTLTAQTYDADWNSVYIPVEGAIITANGEDTGVTTDADGRAVLDLQPGVYLISARSETMTLVPPVCNAVIG